MRVQFTFFVNILWIQVAGPVTVCNCIDAGAMLYQLSYETTQLRAGEFVGLIEEFKIYDATATKMSQILHI